MQQQKMYQKKLWLPLYLSQIFMKEKNIYINNIASFQYFAMKNSSKNLKSLSNKLKVGLEIYVLEIFLFFSDPCGYFLNLWMIMNINKMLNNLRLQQKSLF